MASLTDTILEKDAAVMFACFGELPKIVFEKRNGHEAFEKSIYPKRLLLDRFKAVSNKKFEGTKTNFADRSKNVLEKSQTSGRDSLFKTTNSVYRDIKHTKTTNLYRISISTKRMTHKPSATGVSYSLKTILPTYLRHKQSSTTRIL